MNDLFLELIKVAIGTSDGLSRIPSKEEWRELHDMAKKQSLLGVCVYAIQRMGGNSQEGWKRYAYFKFRNLMVRDGVKFISKYREVTSERLHGCILAILLDKKVKVVNNSYGKNLNFYNSWLTEFEDVELLDS